MIKKLIIAHVILLSTGSILQANTKVTNKLPWPIKFTMYWAGKLPYQDGWRDSYEFDVPAQTNGKAGEREEGADAWNIKNRYVVKIQQGADWVPVYDRNTVEGGNRHVTVYFDVTNPETGEGIVNISSALM